jgi:hypothetical protein
MQPSPSRLVTTQPSTLCKPSALAPFFWLVTYHMARNHVFRGLRVSWNTVPTVAEVWRSHWQHCHKVALTAHARRWSQRGHRKPSGHRIWKPRTGYFRVVRVERDCGRGDRACARGDGRLTLAGCPQFSLLIQNGPSPPARGMPLAAGSPRTAIIQLMPIAIFDSDFTQFGGRVEVAPAGKGDV